MGSSATDYTLKLNTEYEYRLVAGVWDSEDHWDEWRGPESGANKYITLLSASFDKAQILAAGMLAALGLISSAL